MRKNVFGERLDACKISNQEAKDLIKLYKTGPGNPMCS